MTGRRYVVRDYKRIGDSFKFLVFAMLITLAWYLLFRFTDVNVNLAYGMFGICGFVILLVVYGIILDFRGAVVDLDKGVLAAPAKNLLFGTYKKISLSDINSVEVLPQGNANIVMIVGTFGTTKIPFSEIEYARNFVSYIKMAWS